MALKPTIYKLRIALSDLERNHYDTLNLTVALHPSETPERMIARIMAYCINAQEHLTFTQGLSDVTQPDLWIRTLEDTTALWIDVGEPDADRVKKSVRKAEHVKVYSYHPRSGTWWDQVSGKFSQINADVTRFDADAISALASMLTRTVDWSVTITGESAYVATGSGEVNLTWETLQTRA